MGIDNDPDGNIGYKLIPAPHGEFPYADYFIPHVAPFDAVALVAETFSSPKFTVVHGAEAASVKIVDTEGNSVVQVELNEVSFQNFVPPWLKSQEG